MLAVLQTVFALQDIEQLRCDNVAEDGQSVLQLGPINGSRFIANDSPSKRSKARCQRWCAMVRCFGRGTRAHLYECPQVGELWLTGQQCLGTGLGHAKPH